MRNLINAGVFALGLGALVLAGCAQAPGQAEHVIIHADCLMQADTRDMHTSSSACVDVHIAGNGTGGTATSTPTVTTTVPVSVVPK